MTPSRLRKSLAGSDAMVYQALVGNRTFFSSGADLDAHIGRLTSLRAPVWFVTLANDAVTDGTPNAVPVDAFSGWLRTIHSLSARSRVVALHSDFAGLLAVVAGADTIGSGWDRGMRFFDPSSFRVTAPSPRRAASYVTQRGLMGVHRRVLAEDLDRLNPAWAAQLRPGPMPADEERARWHHLGVLRTLVDDISAQPTRRDRVQYLRTAYDDARANLSTVAASIPRSISAADVTAWVDQPFAALEDYARAEGLW